MAEWIHLLLPLLTVLVSLTVSRSQTVNVTAGDSLQAAAGAGWPSPSGRFAFGFYATDGGLAVGVWLATTPNVTVTWTANRNDTPATGGALRLTLDGRLLWTGAGGQDKAVAVPPQPVVAAAMLDDGSFVLYGANGAVVWSTFTAPTDTLVAGQELVPGDQLLSSVSGTNRATGKYQLNNQLFDGNLVMYPVDTESVVAAAYWATGTSRLGFPSALRLDASGALYLVGVGNNSNYTKNLTQPGAAPLPGGGEKLFYRVTLDPDGVLRLYRHAVASTGVAWKTEVQSIGPSDRCLVNGACGLNSYCVLDRDGQPTCLCPPGFEFVDATNAALGCVRRNSGAGEDYCLSHGSTTSSSSSSLSMVPMPNMSWADAPYGILKAGTSAADCQAACLADCLCAAVLLKSEDDTCTKQQLPLRYGRAGSEYTLFVKTAPVVQVEGGRGHRAAIIALACTIGFLACVFLLALLWLNRNRQHVHVVAEDDDEEELPLRSYSYQELDRATGGFREPLGRGAFGTVFRGTLQLRHRNGGENDSEKAVAVKRLEKVVEEGEREFQREVRAIGRTSHRNLVRLLGFCHEGAHRLLVYEYMSNGSLADLLFAGRRNKTTSSSRRQRLGIALDVARGLHYLHDELDSRVIHCDVKPQNILLDAGGTAKIADFGLAKLMLPDQTRTFTGVRGTRGYLAPEWYRGAGPVTVKADVYSYGVVLLEIVTCRRSMEMEEAGEDATLLDWAYDCLLKGDVKNLLTGDQTVDAVEVEKLVKVAVWCAQPDPNARPTMKNVILMLEGHTDVRFPPPPASSY